MSLPPTRQLVLTKLRDCFPDPATAQDALAILDSYGPEEWHRERERVQLAALHQSQGELSRLRDLIAMAKVDFRDVLAGSEFPEEFAAPPNVTAMEEEAMRLRDRIQYEAWLNSGSDETSTS